MDIEKMQVISRRQVDEEEDSIPLPGFRFHPTDEELVGFYLRRKVDKMPLSTNLIKQIDIYKYDPWDLPQTNDLGEIEWYFFCRRGRKYRNSIRPNRVTGSGFWKATGIDHIIYSSLESSGCIGLKKSLVYYRGSVGKGIKTEWMMHEFRLPPSSQKTHFNTKKNKHLDDHKSLLQEVEVWTLCRISKRSLRYRKTLPDMRESSAKRDLLADASSKTWCEDSNYDMKDCISFQPPVIQLNHHEQQQHNHHTNGRNHLTAMGPFISNSAASDEAPSVSLSDQNMSKTIKHGDWDDLISVVEFAEP